MKNILRKTGEFPGLLPYKECSWVFLSLPVGEWVELGCVFRLVKSFCKKERVGYPGEKVIESALQVMSDMGGIKISSG